MRARINRLFHGYASIRSYIVDRAIRNKENLVIQYDNKQMTVVWQDLDKGFKNTDVFRSKHNNMTYTLVDYDWAEDNRQQELW